VCSSDLDMPLDQAFTSSSGGGGGGGGKPGQSQPVPTLAELLVLRAMQQDLIDRTHALDVSGGGQDASETQLRNIKRLGEDQEEVRRLKRVSIGPIKIKGLAVGQWRILTSAEVNMLKADEDAVLSSGFAPTSVSDGTKTTGTYTPTYIGGNKRHIVNGGAFTLAAPTVTGDPDIHVQITNNASAGAITLSGFESETGDAFTTTNGHDFICKISKHNGFQTIDVVKLQ